LEAEAGEMQFRHRSEIRRDKLRRAQERVDVRPGWRASNGKSLTVDVMSAEQTSQTYLTPPSPPRVPCFFRMTPISSCFTFASRAASCARSCGSSDD